MEDDKDYAVGKGRPPAGTQFKPGQSGNPGGRPRGKSKGRLYPVLDQMVTVRDGNAETKMRADRAFLLSVSNRGQRNSSFARLMLTGVAAHRAKQPEDVNSRTIVYCVYPEDGRPYQVLRSLEAASLLDRFRPTAQNVLEPWLVEEALRRLGDRRLSIDDQRHIVAATRTPHKVAWPGWWSEHA